MSNPAGRHFLQIPGPCNMPDRILRATDMPIVDHRGPDFPQLTGDVIDGMKRVFQTEADVVIFPSSGTGAWEAALVNTLSPGERVLMFETGQFATLWRNKVFRIGHLGDFNDLMLIGTLGGVEMGLANAGIAFTRGGADAALDYLASHD